ncbi:MAG: hypothetical protein LBS70_00910 [Candidatus Accumulibacter sp.]|jgi:hypothetical protein|nr:hypothetical protein [Accumulibacter sp.]
METIEKRARPDESGQQKSRRWPAWSRARGRGRSIFQNARRFEKFLKRTRMFQNITNQRTEDRGQKTEIHPALRAVTQGYNQDRTLFEFILSSLHWKP